MHLLPARRIFALLTAALALGAIAPGAAAQTAQAAPAGPTIASKLETLGDMTYIRVTALRSAMQNGRLQVQARLQNDSTDRQSLAYRIKWLDDGQFSVWEDEAWKPLLLNGRQALEIQGLSPSTRATDFRIELHAADNSTPLFNLNSQPAAPNY